MLIWTLDKFRNIITIYHLINSYIFYIKINVLFLGNFIIILLTDTLRFFTIILLINDIYK